MTVQQGEDKMLIYWIRKDNWANTLYIFIQSHFFKLFTALWYTLYIGLSI